MENDEKMNPEKDRNKLFSYLDTVLSVSHEKFKLKRGRGNHTLKRMKWGRLLKDCVLAYGKLLEVHELEQMAKDIEEIKKKVGL